MGRHLVGALLACISLGATVATSMPIANAASPQAERGAYLVAIGGCNDCHTPGSFFGKPDPARVLGGSDVSFATPEGIFTGPNLTPDRETGLGNWTAQQIVTAITKGERPDGRILAEIMPWRSLSALTHDDAFAVAAYLKSLPAVSHRVPGPLGPNAEAPGFVMTIMPGKAYAAMPKAAP